MLELSDITAGYGGTTVLSEVDLSLSSGITALLGPNGAGKTTFFRVAAGVLAPSSGTVTLDGRDPHVDPEVKRELRYVPHTPRLYRDLTVEENIEFWGRLSGLSQSIRRDRCDRLADRLAFSDLLSTPGRKLSRGQAQRVSVAVGLLPDPSVLFLDEPSSGLDPAAAGRLYNLLREFADDDQLIVHATHNLTEANRLAEDVVLLNNGSVVGHGSKEEVKRLFEGDQTVHIRAEGENVRAVLADTGHDVTRAGGYWEVTLPAGADLTDLFVTLSDAGVEVRELRTEDGGLRHLYDQFGSGTGSNMEINQE